MRRTLQNFRGRGFTIVELLIVITIIMILAVMGAQAYSIGRRVVIIDLHAEKLVSTLNSLRDKTKAGSTRTVNATGVVDNVAGPKCFGILFQRSAAPQQIMMPYLDVRRGCDTTARLMNPLDWQSDVIVKSVMVNGQPQDTELPIVFTPPHGNLAPINGITNQSENSTFTFQIEYKDRTRTIEVNEAAGRIEKKVE